MVLTYFVVLLSLSVLVIAQPETTNLFGAPIVDESPSGRFTWTIRNFSRSTKKLYSEDFYVGGYRWYVDFCTYASVDNACYLYRWMAYFACFCSGLDLINIMCNLTGGYLYFQRGTMLISCHCI